MSKSEIQAYLDQLQELCSKMDVPVYKRDNVKWLKDHLAVRNKDHFNFPEAMRIVDLLLHQGVAHR